MSTKKCPYCAGSALVSLISLDRKICVDCGKEIPWNLEPGQKPLFEGTKQDKS